MTDYAKFKCPTCSGFIPNNTQIGAYVGAISRRDGKTEICSACGTREALEDIISHRQLQFIEPETPNDEFN